MGTILTLLIILKLQNSPLTQRRPLGEILLETKDMPKSLATMKLSSLEKNHIYDVIMNSQVKVLGTETMIDK